jgi:putative ABC transport system substrate-binding protein
VLVPYAKLNPVAQSAVGAFTQAFAALGWADGRNVNIDFRWADSSAFDQMQSIAKEVVALRPDVIVALNGAPWANAVQQETRAIPIVFTGASDPVGLGLVESFAHPGGNTTGLSLYESSVGSKWLEALKRIAPAVRRIALIYNPQTSVPALYLPSIEPAAVSLSVELMKAPVMDTSEIEPIMAGFSRERGGGLMFLPDYTLVAHRDAVVGLAAQYRLPAIYPLRFFTDSGGLMSYSVDVDDLDRRAAAYVDRILKGAKPSELPVQQPTKYEFVINLKTAKALGLDISPALLSVADELIE